MTEMNVPDWTVDLVDPVGVDRSYTPGHSVGFSAHPHASGSGTRAGIFRESQVVS